MSHDALVHDKITEQELHALVKIVIADRNPDCNYAQTITDVRTDPSKPLPFWAKDSKMSMILPAVRENTETNDGDEAAFHFETRSGIVPPATKLFELFVMLL